MFSPRLSVKETPRSAWPLAAAGITCIGLIPALGGPDAPLHWFMTAGITGLGLLLGLRHRLYQREAALTSPTAAEARRTGRHLLLIAAICTVLASGIMAMWLVGGGKPLAVSLVLPAIGLAWVTWLGFKVLRLSEQPITPVAEEAAPRSSAGWEPRPSQAPSTRSPNRQVSA